YSLNVAHAATSLTVSGGGGVVVYAGTYSGVASIGATAQVNNQLTGPTICTIALTTTANGSYVVGLSQWYEEGFSISASQNQGTLEVSQPSINNDVPAGYALVDAAVPTSGTLATLSLTASTGGGS